MPPVTLPKLLPYQMTALYICECMVNGRCTGWIVNNGLVFRPGASRLLRGWKPCSTAIEAWRLVGGDPEAYRMIALLDYAARHRLDPRLLPGYIASKAWRAAEALEGITASRLSLPALLL